jgi:uncharacterized repeat protein (TIGR03833 family)
MTSARLASVGRVVAGRRPARRARVGERRAIVRASAREEDVEDDARCGRRRDALSVGDVVEIALVKRPGDGDATRTARGEISDFVTNSSFHADGIKVRLRSGEIGRVTRAAWADDEDEEEEDDETAAAADRSSSGSGTSTTSTKTTGSTTPSVEEGGAVRTAYVSRVSKTADVAAVKSLASALPGVRNVRVPVRGGGHMGYMFVECEDGEGMRGVIEALHGMEFEGNALVAQRAKEDPKPKKSKASANANDKKTTANKANKKTKEKKKSRAEIEAEEKERKLMDARAQMEAEALAELERAKRRRERELEAQRAELEVKRAAEEDAERRARNLLERRAAAAKARADRAAAAAAAAEARLAAAAALGDVRVDPSWRPRVAVLRDALDKLRVDIDRDAESAVDER